jgi:hypothetical protein
MRGKRKKGERGVGRGIGGRGHFALFWNLVQRLHPYHKIKM